MGKISTYPVVTSMASQSYFLVDTYPIGTNSTSIISKSNVLPMIDARDYGAVGDGSTDNTAAIQNAINVAKNTGQTIYFAPGTYNISNTLTLYTGVGIQGEGSEATTIHQTSTSHDGFDSNDAASVTLQGFFLEGPGSGTGVGINMGWTSNGNVPYLDFRDLKVYSFGSDGIAIETPIVSTFSQVVCKSNGGYGVNFYHAGTSCTFTSCWMRENALAGYHFYESVYMNLSGCAADGNTVGYFVENAQSIGFYACGAESQVLGSGDFDGSGFKISNSSVVGMHNVWITNNVAIGIYITNGSIACEIFGAADNSPGIGATAFVQTDVSTNTTLSDIHNTTADSYSSGTVTVLNDGANGMLTKYIDVKDSSGTMTLSAAPDGGAYNVFVDTTGTLAFFGSGGQSLDIELIDGFLQLDTLTATTVPYLNSSKQFASSAVTPTQLGYLSGVSGTTGSGSLVLATSPTVSGLTVSTELDLVGSSGTLHFTAATDGGDYNIFSSNGNQTLAIYGSGGNTLNLNLLDGNLTVTDGLIFPQQATTVGAPSYVKGAMYFDTTLNKLRIGGASAWETVTSS